MNKGTGILLGCAGIVVIFALIIGGMFFSNYNKLVTMSKDVDGQWAQIDVQLKRRFDLIPNLQATVKGYAQQEKDIFKMITDARAAYGKATTTDDKAKAAGQFESSLSRLMVIMEKNPEIKSSALFQDLMVSLEGTENRISTERVRYNEKVKAFNTAINVIPGRFFAGMLGYKDREFFKVDESQKEAPKVDFSK